MARYLVLIYGEEEQWAAAAPSWHRENARQHQLFLDQAGSAVAVGGELAPSATAISIRGSDPAGSSQPGPFTFADKAIGGFYLIEADDLAAAVRLARQLPETRTGHSGIEVRAVVSPS